MNEVTAEVVLEDPALDPASSETVEDAPLFYGDEVSVVAVSTSDRPFLTTALNDYSVTEGLLLMILLVLFFSQCIKIIKEGFWWL